jgi:hypothetical protein
MQPTLRVLHRWTGRALVSGVEREWSLVLKLSRRDPRTDDPSAWNYWKREFLAYRSGILDDLPGIAAPRVYGADERDGEFTILWLEDVPESVSGRWPTERYVLAARHLGEFNGAYLAGRPIPDAPFLTRTQLRSWATWLSSSDIIRSKATWGDRIVVREIAVPPIDRLERLHAAMPALLDALDRLPQTFSHLDCWRANLISARGATGAPRTVAIDWSSVGRAPLGQDLAILVFGSQIWLDAEPSDLTTLSARAFESYLDGARAAGWTGDVGRLRFAYAASAALYMGPPLPFWIARVAEPARREWLQRKCGRPIEEVVHGWSLLLDHVLDLAAEAEGDLSAVEH